MGGGREPQKRAQLGPAPDQIDPRKSDVGRGTIELDLDAQQVDLGDRSRTHAVAVERYEFLKSPPVLFGRLERHLSESHPIEGMCRIQRHLTTCTREVCSRSLDAFVRRPHLWPALKQRLERQREVRGRLAIDARFSTLAGEARVFRPERADRIGKSPGCDAAALCGDDPCLGRFEQRVLEQRGRQHAFERSLGICLRRSRLGRRPSCTKGRNGYAHGADPEPRKWSQDKPPARLNDELGMGRTQNGRAVSGRPPFGGADLLRQEMTGGPRSEDERPGGDM